MSSVDVAQNIDDAAVVVSVKGEIDTGTVASVSEALVDALAVAQDRANRLLVVDLVGVGYFGSAGLNAVLDCHERGATAGVAVRLVATGPEVTRPIELTKLEAVLRPFASVSEAISADGR